MKSNSDIDEYVRRFGKRVREIREGQRISQEDLAERAEVHRTYIGMVERGEKNATIATIVKLAHALAVSPRDLLPKT